MQILVWLLASGRVAAAAREEGGRLRLRDRSTGIVNLRAYLGACPYRRGLRGMSAIQSYRPNCEACCPPRCEIRKAHRHPRSAEDRARREKLPRGAMPVRLRKRVDARPGFFGIRGRAIVRMLSRPAEIRMAALPGLRGARPDPAGPPELLAHLRIPAGRCRLAVAKPVL